MDLTVEYREFAFYLMRMCLINRFNLTYAPSFEYLDKKIKNEVKLNSEDCDLIKRYQFAECVPRNITTNSLRYMKEFVDMTQILCLENFSQDSNMVPWIAMLSGLVLILILSLIFVKVCVLNKK